ncbi:hypothetical protein MVLG_06025 [Microbotryum lychnidis-dioicae p1A1 Lamole]|uniref:Uncharacterized protein n=1 Tax=Microbotryum lychnidis-dioicae (strain p1A1 Lamole / MvSl-1064) TaxID=683840 RepID=U5HG04_USTV1|nr:hypothetical protein MVLG_06025 [Microbotryum lychnidis-dioicae p1A1 Lamole]|eukprot:KDE03513.1 hypothetical protein MVLG_06025 [Microbotryum lychnidis-dioicae p1A1 Lamole]
MGSPSSSSALDHCAARSPETVPVVSAPVVSAPVVSAPVVSAPVVSVPVALPAEEVVVDSSLEPAPGAVSPPSSSPPTHHRVTATGVLATTTTALVHNRLTHAAGGMLSSTLTGLFTLLLVLFVYRKSFLLPFGGSSSSRNLSLTEYNTEYNRHVGASGTASGKARPHSPDGSSTGESDATMFGTGPQAARRSPRSPPPPARYPGRPIGTNKPTLRIKLDQDQVVDEEGEVYRCIIKSPLPEGSLKPCLRRAMIPTPTATVLAEEGETQPLLLDVAPSSPTPSSNDGHEPSTSSLSSPTSKKTVRLIEPAHSACELDRLRFHWASCATSPASKGIGGYRSTRDIYAKGQGGDRNTTVAPAVKSPTTNAGSYLKPHEVPAPREFDVDEQNNSLGLDVTPLGSNSARAASTGAGGGSTRRRLSPSPSGRFIKDSIRSTSARSVSPIPNRLAGNGPAYLRTSSPAGPPGMTNHSTNASVAVGGGPRSESPGRPKWVRQKNSSSMLGESNSTSKSSLSNSTNLSTTITTSSGSGSGSGARPIRTIVLDGSEDSEGYEDCSEGSGTTTPVYGGVGGVGASPLSRGKAMLLGEGLRMSELMGKVGELPGNREGELPLISVEAPRSHVPA